MTIGSLFSIHTVAELPVTICTDVDFSTINNIEVVSTQLPMGMFVALAYNGAFFEAAFVSNLSDFLLQMQQKYTNARFTVNNPHLQSIVESLFKPEIYSTLSPVTILLSGTPFQLKVWNELLKIPFGKTIAYNDIAIKLDDKNASRAVGTAVGQNKIAYLIPCHRVIAKNGKLSNFRWGIERKKQLLAWEYTY
jgi:AraC family transcriptional regulator of adaptative response/methylated-DNA-[protein]-cysteine methyltransferase